jgi:outer membrane protein assembly complex protein YaeT
MKSTVRLALSWTAAVALALLGGAAASAQSPEGKVIAQVVVQGNRQHSTEQVLAQLNTKPGLTYSRSRAEEDVRRLDGAKWFAFVEVFTSPTPDDRLVVIFRVTEYAGMVREVVYLNNQHLKKSELDEITGLRPNVPLNPAGNWAARQAILRKYQETGRLLASVELVEGGNASDTRVVFRITEGPVVKVKQTAFQGNSFIGSERLRTQLNTSRAFVGIGGDYDPRAVESDQEKIEEYYHNLGFHDCRVSRDLEWLDDRSVRVVFHVHEGPRYRVRRVQLSGNKQFTEDQLMAEAKTRPGNYFSRTDLQADMTHIRDTYGMHGHPVGVVPAFYQCGPGEMDVQLEVQERPRFYVGEVQIIGNTVTRDNVIRRQLGIYPGQVLQFPALLQAEQNLTRLNIFETKPEEGVRPTVTVQDLESDNPVKNVLVQVQESATGQFMLGLGVNSDAGLTGSIVLNERNFDLFRPPTSLEDIWAGRAFRGGGQEFRVEAVPGSSLQRYSVSWREPSVFDTPYSLGTSGYYFQRSYNEYSEDRVGGRVTVGRRVGQYWNVQGSLRLEDVNVYNVQPFEPPDILVDQGHHLLVGLRGSVQRDTRDSYLRPTTGSVIEAGYEQVMGDFSFPIATLEASQYFTTTHRADGSGKQVLALRSQLAVAGSNAPVFERFYAGGFRSLRGFQFRGVGPFEPGPFGGSFNVGGDFSFLNTIEYQVPLVASDKVFGVAFLDHGTVERNVEIKNYRVSAGFGFRFVVPMLGPVPIATDFAFPITKAPGDERQIFSFWLGFFNS